MSIVQNIAAIALRQLIPAALAAAGVEILGSPAAAAVDAIRRHFRDPSQRLPKALQAANDKAWMCLEMALAGETFWDRFKLMIASGEKRGFRQEARAFLEIAQPGLWADKAQHRQQCLRELCAAKKAGLLSGEIALKQLDQAGAFARYGGAEAVQEAEWQLVANVAKELDGVGHKHLAWFIRLRPQGKPLLAIAISYFFHREVQSDPALARSLSLQRLEGISEAQDIGFKCIAHALSKHSHKVEQALGTLVEIALQTRTMVGQLQHGLGTQGIEIFQIKETLGGQNRALHNLGSDAHQISGQVQHVDTNVQKIDATVQQMGADVQQIDATVQQLLHQHQLLKRELRPADSLSIRGDAERKIVKHVLAQYRGLSELQRQQWPQLLNNVGKLEFAAGDFDAASIDFQKVAAISPDPAIKGQAYFDAYRAALEKRDWHQAFVELRNAVQADAKRFAPFNMNKYKPRHILGAGGFGVAFLCHHAAMNTEVVVKTIDAADLDCDTDRVFEEARRLKELNHPAIPKLWDCGYVSPSSRSRPHMIVDYFDGTSLEECVKTGGPLDPNDGKAIMLSIAEALQAAHRQGILHRDVKPGNILVRRNHDTWETRLIDFGLALKHSLLSTVQGQETLLGRSVVGTQGYAAPEQMGQLDAVVGPHSDVYAFGKTCYYALLGTPHPDDHEKNRLPPTWKALLRDCTARTLENRLPDISTVVRRLANRRSKRAPRVPVPLLPPKALESTRPAQPEAIGSPKAAGGPVSVETQGQTVWQPRALREFIGQRAVAQRLAIAIKAAWKLREPLAHILLEGPSGAGKATLAALLPIELGTSLQVTDSYCLRKSGSLLSLLTNAEEGSIVVVKDIERLRPAVQELLLAPLTAYRFDIELGNEVNKRTISQRLKRFTLVGTTSRGDKVPDRLRRCFVVQEQLVSYSIEEVTGIIRINAGAMGFSLTDDAAREIALASAGIPGKAIDLLRWVRRYAISEGYGEVELETARRALALTSENASSRKAACGSESNRPSLFPEKSQNDIDLDAYFRDVDRAPVLTGEEERRLAKRIQCGDSEARDHMVRANLRLVADIAREDNGKGRDVSWLIAKGNAGLTEAAESFEPDSNVRFSAYASELVRQSIARALVSESQPKAKASFWDRVRK